MKTFLGRNSYDWVTIGTITIGTVIVFNLLGCGIALAEVIPETLAVKAIIGEALHDDESMLVMAHAIRNRVNSQKGSFKGIYGLKVAIPGVTDKLRARALKQWYLSLSTRDVTNGATHWLSDYDLKHCRPAIMIWRFKMKKTLYQGKTHFYKEI